MATTPNYGWEIPTVGGDSGAWGTKLNTLFNAADAALKAVSDIANAALARAGGTMTGLLTLKTVAQSSLDLGGISGTKELDLSVAQSYTATITGPIAFTATHAPVGFSGFVLRLTNPGSAAITWPSGTKWPGGSAPAFTAAGVDLVVLTTHDSGTTWSGVISMKDVR